MRFNEVAGQAVAKDNLIRMWKSGRMPHAILLLGREGTGGLPLGIAFAQYVLCSDKRGDDSCGECANCHKVQRLEHADLHLSFPSIRPKSDKPAVSSHYIKEFRQFVRETPYGTTYDWLQAINAENKQGNLSAEECRAIIDQLNLMAYEGGTKIQLIWRPEYLGKEGNILLKLIEEPPANTIIIFIAENVEDILATIQSRTQLIRLTPVAPAEIAAALTDRGLANERRATQIGQIADGSFTEALSLLQHMENDLLPSVRALFNALFTNSGTGLVQFTDEWAKAGREGIRNFISFILTLLEGSLRASHLPDAANRFAPEEADFIRKLASRKLPVEVFSKMIDAFTDAAYHIERNAHSKSVLMGLCIHLRRIIAAGSSRP